MKKKMLICGAAGFIGRNIAEFFADKQQYQVYGTYHRSKPLDHPNIKMIRADLTDRADVNACVKGMDILIQAAATTSGARDIVNSPAYHVTDNALINALVFRAAYEEKLSHVLFFSCTTMYQSAVEPVKETDFDANAKIQDCYFGGAWTKVYNEKMCEFYAAQGNTKFTAARHSNIYGPYDKYDLHRSHVFGATVTKVETAAEGDSIVVWGDGSQGRDMLYVSDLVDFVQLALERQKAGFELFNVGCGSAVTVKDMVSKIIKESGKNLIMEFDPSKPSINTSLCLDSSRAHKLLGWHAKVSFEDGIRETLNWYRNKGQ